MKYLAIIGDVVDSKSLPHRAEFQQQLAEALKKASHRNPTLVSPYTITLGDEFQAVYDSADRLFADLFGIWHDVHPAKIRFAIGVGELSTAINPKQALGMDGPAFHRARAAIAELKGTDHWIRLQGDPPPQGPAFDHWNLFQNLFDLVGRKLVRWEKNRLFILRGLLGGLSVSEIEAKLDISRVAVYKNINAAALDEMKGLCDQIAKFLNEELKKR